MKKLVTLFAAISLALASGAFAQDYATNQGGGNSASLSERVNVDIPHRVGLHITRTSLGLDLNDLESFNGSDGQCYLVRKDDIGNFGHYDEFVDAIDFDNKVSTYPAAVLDSNGNVMTDAGEYLKGGLACETGLVVQKFSNYTLGWELTADVNIPATSGIKFGIMDMAEGNPWFIEDGDTDLCIGIPTWFGCIGYDSLSEFRRHFAEASFGYELDNATLAEQRVGRTNGWLDDYITQYFYFDGSENPGSHKVSVQYTLTGGW